MSKTKEFFTDVQTIIANSIPVSFDDAGQIAGNVLEYCNISKGANIAADVVDALFTLDAPLNEAQIISLATDLGFFFTKNLFKSVMLENGYTIEEVAHYIKILFSQPANKWFRPSNKENEVYSICYQLAEIGLIKKRITDNIVAGKLQGRKVEFFYSL